VSSADASTADSHDEFFGAILGGELTADQLLRRYCTLVYCATGSYEATARKLKLDRRTVRAKVDAATVALLQSVTPAASRVTTQESH
jgi:hypothetical protein